MVSRVARLVLSPVSPADVSNLDKTNFHFSTVCHCSTHGSIIKRPSRLLHRNYVNRHSLSLEIIGFNFLKDTKLLFSTCFVLWESLTIEIMQRYKQSVEDLTIA